MTPATIQSGDNATLSMRARPCSICGSVDHPIWMKADVNLAALDGFAFASRKLPEYMHFDLALCPQCDLVYASSVPKAEWFATSYKEAQFDAEAESQYAAKTYAKELQAVLPLLLRKDTALDIGAGDGAFVATLVSAGFSHVVGVEPSIEPVNRATPTIRSLIRNEFFSAANFEKNSFDLITCFQTLEHLEDPLKLCQDSYELLRTGGIFLAVTHDFRAPLARIMGKRSPIYDVEHLQLFSQKSLTGLYRTAGFSDIHIRTLRNSYPVKYWLKLLPLPYILKKTLMKQMSDSKIGQLMISAKVGNLIAFAIKD
jgi:SAM-dependent methyltransferase